MIHGQENRNKPNLKLRFLVGLSILAVIAGFSGLVLTASAQNSNAANDETGLNFLDPFELIMINVGSTSTAYNLQSINLSRSCVTRPPIRIPFKPELRSKFSPSWTPNLPSWAY